MLKRLKFYIDGSWVDPAVPKTIPVVNPATEKVMHTISAGSVADVNKAVTAARRALASFANSSVADRVGLLTRIIEIYKTRAKEIGAAISDEMGAPHELAERAQAGGGLLRFVSTLDVLKNYSFQENIGRATIVREPIGVVGMITPWNWPLNQIACKVAPAIAAGCTIILKPSEITPSSALILAEILHDAGLPDGVFNLINGHGPEVGAAMAEHDGIDMISFTGSTRAGIDVAKRSAETVKRVSQELGGKSANIILDDADFDKTVVAGVLHAFNNSGQTCNSPTRMIVPAERMEQVASIAKSAADGIVCGDPRSSKTIMGPVATRLQWERVQSYIKKGIDEGARLVSGGVGLPTGLNKGFYVRPTVFADVTREMTIAREEIFGPVLTIIGAGDEDEAIRIANDSPYGLAGYVSSGSPERASRVARQIRAGNVNLNGAPNDPLAPFGGYKQSGNGREWGRFGLEEFLEVKAIVGLNAA
jgi:aldehyde dehydrogenase (NAD+)